MRPSRAGPADVTRTLFPGRRRAATGPATAPESCQNVRVTDEISPLVRHLGLEPHVEGGWFRETWRTATTMVPDGYPSRRAVATGIYYLLHPGERSRWHRGPFDELWLWHSGGPLSLRLGGTGAEPGEHTSTLLGMSLTAGEQPQLTVPGGEWQTAEPVGDEPVLVSCVVAPGFDFADFSAYGGDSA
jgi:predicted cupin superfamily sugar epimerase